MKKLTIIIEKNKDGLWGQLAQYPNIFSHGNDLTELQHNCLEAYELLMDIKSPEPIEFDIEIDLTAFFVVNNYINISSLAERIGINQSLLRQYARGIKFPGLRQVEKIQNAVHLIGQELMNTKLKPVS